MPAIRPLSLIFLLCLSGLANAAPSAEISDEARLVAQGKRMYREGILPSGAPMWWRNGDTR